MRRSKWVMVHYDLLKPCFSQHLPPMARAGAKAPGREGNQPMSGCAKSPPPMTWMPQGYLRVPFCPSLPLGSLLSTLGICTLWHPEGCR